MVVHSAFVYQGRIADGVTKAEASLARDVVYIRYNVGEDWRGEEAVFFRVILKDASSDRAHLREVANRVKQTVFREVNPGELGLQAYFNFRSESEQAQLREEAWA